MIQHPSGETCDAERPATDDPREFVELYTWYDPPHGSQSGISSVVTSIYDAEGRLIYREPPDTFDELPNEPHVVG